MSAFDFGTIDPGAFARQVGETPDDQLEAGMASEYRELVLDGIFEQMAARLDPDRARGTDAVVHWRIKGRPDGGEDVYELAISDGACELSKREAKHSPRLALVTDAVSFLKLVTGNENGPKLFMFGKLKVEGDVMFAARLQGLFRMPDGMEQPADAAEQHAPAGEQPAPPAAEPPPPA